MMILGLAGYAKKSIFADMEVFYSNDIRDGRIRLSPEESAHCVKVLRHRVGDEVYVSGGDGNLYRCTLEEADSRAAVARVLSVEGGFGTHPYRLWMAVAPTKNIDRFEWFTEKATEMGVDRITPLLCSHSERKVYNQERGQRVIVAAAKQSLKGKVPQLDGLTPFRALMEELRSAGFTGQKFIAYCDSDIAAGLNTRVPLTRAVAAVKAEGEAAAGEALPGALFLIGPEGDFSSEEIAAAMEAGFTPLSLGPSRLRTETAAALCVAAVYTALCV